MAERTSNELLGRVTFSGRRQEAADRNRGTNEGRQAALAPLNNMDEIHPRFLQTFCSLVLSGADRDRTGDPLLAKQVLSQLS